LRQRRLRPRPARLCSGLGAFPSLPLIIISLLPPVSPLLNWSRAGRAGASTARLATKACTTSGKIPGRPGNTTRPCQKFPGQTDADGCDFPECRRLLRSRTASDTANSTAPRYAKMSGNKSSPAASSRIFILTSHFVGAMQASPAAARRAREWVLSALGIVPPVRAWEVVPCQPWAAAAKMLR